MAAGTPIISKKQEKNTLSAKKKKPEVIKNVLAQPYHTHWPKLSVEDNNHLTETLGKFLPELQLIKPKVPYRQIKNIPKEDRKNFRKTLCKDTPNDIPKPEERNVLFGVNDAAKLIERLEASAVLVSSDVQPRLLVQHVIDQALLYHIPVLVVDGLKTVCRKKCGISGAVMSLKKTVEPDSELGVVLQTIRNISENYQKPKHHINSNRSLDVSAITIDDSLDEESIIEDDDDDDDESKNYHLKKPGGKKRAFLPENASQEKVIDFINLDCSESPSKKINSNQKQQYHPLKVKRFKGNKNRNKRKMQKFAKKKN